MHNRHWKMIAAVSVLMILLSGTALASKHDIHFGKKGIKGSGDMETREIDVDEFDRIYLSGAFDVEISFGTRQKVEVTIDDNLWDILEVEVDGHSLELGWEKSCRPDGDCKVEIVVESLEAFKLSGAGNVDINDFDGPSFTFSLSGAGDLTMDGEVDDLEIRLSGAGNVDTRRLMARNVEIGISGAGNADVYASESLNGKVSGVGNLDYYGDPERKKTRVSGIGRINQK
jgi:Putative auto-transporter adhesin, head GIN domain